MDTSTTSPPRTAFVLGAGLGTRLRPYTADCPKPLLPIGGRPLICSIFDRLTDAGISSILINTHHCPERYAETFPDSHWRGTPLTFIHEPTLLDTAGGLKNIAPHWTDDAPLLLHNGDILTDLPLAPLISRHQQLTQKHNVLCTLATRTDAEPRHLAWDTSTHLLTDIRDTLRPAPSATTEHALYTGIALINKPLLTRIPEGKILGLVPVWLDALRSGHTIGIATIQSGSWNDIGTIETYEALRQT